jgi:hypothetical protein
MEKGATLHLLKNRSYDRHYPLHAKKGRAMRRLTGFSKSVMGGLAFLKRTAKN